VSGILELMNFSATTLRPSCIGVLWRICAAFRDSLEGALFRANEPPHVTTQEEKVGETTNKTEGRFPLEGIAHSSYAIFKFEFVHVPEPFERALNHFIDESLRPIKRGDSRDKALRDAQVAAFESDDIADFKQAMCSTRFNDALRREDGRLGMGIYIAREIEAQLDGRADSSFNDDHSHAAIQFFGFD
jgi:hypothetical protein